MSRRLKNVEKTIKMGKEESVGNEGITCTLPLYIGEGNGTPLQYSCLENPMEGGAW